MCMYVSAWGAKPWSVETYIHTCMQRLSVHIHEKQSHQVGADKITSWYGVAYTSASFSSVCVCVKWTELKRITTRCTNTRRRENSVSDEDGEQAYVGVAYSRIRHLHAARNSGEGKTYFSLSSGSVLSSANSRDIRTQGPHLVPIMEVQKSHTHTNTYAVTKEKKRV
jgi:hypothetical protein